MGVFLMFKKVIFILVCLVLVGPSAKIKEERIRYFSLSLKNTYFAYAQVEVKPKTKIIKKTEKGVELKLVQVPSFIKEIYLSNLDDIKHVLEYTNQFRQTKLVLDEELSLLATLRALEIAESKYFYHERPNGQKVESILTEYNYPYKYFGENIAKGYFEASLVVEAWHNSAGHFRNMTDPKFNKIGIGRVQIEKRCYYVEFFVGY